ncbi:20366_t:CDS:1, partial [Gigaspora margarita]
MEIEKDKQWAEIESSRVSKNSLYKIDYMTRNLIMLLITTVERIKDDFGTIWNKSK